ncbi:hypothetical protein C6B37_00895 [Candidatus Phytoplasma phoenicium]|uniref:Uncharacterized protein n=1 Tax=Candidatus Phytoplasma phoenicium TaxID=198422 RepID=A0A2S8NV68_9MOLU|nr:hypothetical protein C6B37_00895 [Candidatus Phytoplasma phoenicium]
MVDEIHFNNYLFSSSQINQMKEQIKTKTYNDLVLTLNFGNILTLEQIKDKVQEFTFTIIQTFSEDKWDDILKKLPPIHLPSFVKIKLLHQTKKQNINKLFNSHLHEEEILNFINKDIEQSIQKFHMEFNQKISNDVHKYILIERLINKHIDSQTIELISKGAILLVQQLLNQKNITEKEIDDQVRFFVKNYQFDDINSSSNNFLIFSFIRKNFFDVVLSVSFLFIIKALFFKK